MSETFSIEQSGNECRFSGVLDFSTASRVLEQLQDCVRSHDTLSIDFSQAGRCNSAALAVMIELQAEASRCGHQVGFTSIPGGIRQLAEVCQVEDFL